MGPHSSRQRSLRAATLVAAVLVLVGCQQSDAARHQPTKAATTTTTTAPDRPTAQRQSARPPAIAKRYLTRDHAGDVYRVTAGDGALRVDAPTTNVGALDGTAGTRMVMWPTSPQPAEDLESCATWTDARGPWAQQGIALRIRTDGERFRTIVVAKNVLFGAEWQFNVDTWDTERWPNLRHHGVVILRNTFSFAEVPRPLPWRVCARVRGEVVEVKGWRPEEPEPAWGDPEHSGAVRLGPNWVFAGRAGWYVGHIAPGGTIAMDDLGTSGEATTGQARGAS